MQIVTMKINRRTHGFPLYINPIVSVELSLDGPLDGKTKEIIRVKHGATDQYVAALLAEICYNERWNVFQQVQVAVDEEPPCADADRNFIDDFMQAHTSIHDYRDAMERNSISKRVYNELKGFLEVDMLQDMADTDFKISDVLPSYESFVLGAMAMQVRAEKTMLRSIFDAYYTYYEMNAGEGETFLDFVGDDFEDLQGDFGRRFDEMCFQMRAPLLLANTFMRKYKRDLKEMLQRFSDYRKDERQTLKEHRCPTCHGTGYAETVDDIPSIEVCVNCAGTGFVKELV